MLVKRIKKLYSIDPRSWEHPADTAALSAVKRLKGLDELVKGLVSATTERSLRLMVLASSVKVSRNQYARVNNVIENVVDTFDWDYSPTVFITQSPFLNAGVLGVKEPFIIVNSSVVKNFDDLELTAIVAHEMGHIMSGHALYKTLIWMLTNVSMGFIPGGQLVANLVMAALAEWNRKSELTSDRAELLATQDETPSYNILMRMAGGEDLSQVNLNEFFAQAQEYEEQKSLLDSIHKILNQVWLSHPYPVMRLQELKSWASSGYYQAILDGNYLKRGLVKEDADQDMKAGFEFYKESVRNADDPISRFVSSVGDEIEKAAGDIGDKLKELLNNNNDRKE
jgi:Zn-dependent protease with chaperone function